MTSNKLGITPLTDAELGAIHGGRSLWGSIKAAARWVKDHVKVGLKSIGIGGKF